jgi:RNA polymerase sigma factor (sigma-70 family)
MKEKQVSDNRSVTLAMEDAIVKEGARLRNFIRRKVPSLEDAEDILQDVYYQFVQLMQLETIDKAASWLYKVAGYRITDWYRKRKTLSLESMRTGRSKEEEEEGPLMLQDILYDPADEPDQLYIRSTVWPLLTDALEDLPEEQREVFVMHELENIPFKEISRLTGVPVNTLISRKRYAVLYLRDQLQELYNEYFNE